MSNKTFIAFIIVVTSSLASVALMFCFFVAGYKEGVDTCRMTQSVSEINQGVDWYTINQYSEITHPPRVNQRETTK
ncbi:hypothetical protein PP939_gp211 [Rhizobium phage RL38J1]|uniref:Uncharacterized protein n=1 Tax=Rhizobium phage RL38J1 TaxID=2663232 RepID=A0A6B9J1D1_9CAUD|nr:hypothetical protein PP939_gp211 [Rhizobium phage RL38J1]QGZ14044.1 hypothetical protein RL38J1_211 [Rhizobium phage RL38J1]